MMKVLQIMMFLGITISGMILEISGAIGAMAGAIPGWYGIFLIAAGFLNLFLITEFTIKIQRVKEQRRES